MITALFIVGICYAAALGLLLAGYFKLDHKALHSVDTNVDFSIIVPFRNEEENLEALVSSIRSLDYPSRHFELLFVDDQSTDRSIEILKNSLIETKLNWAVLKNEPHSGSPKKDAITLGVSRAKAEWILTTDADCILPRKWLEKLSAFIVQNRPKMICGPVGLNAGKGLLSSYQLTEHLALQTTTMGGFGLGWPLLCNGANLGFTRSGFDTVGGYNGNDHVGSGDDIYLMEKFRRYFPKEVFFIKSEAAIVQTNTVKSWKDLLAQRTRWASKMGRLPNLLAGVIGLIVLLTNTLMVVTLSYSLLVLLTIPAFVLIFLVLKCLVDFLFIWPVSRFFPSRISLIYLPLLNILYPFISCWIGLKSIFGTYKWKDRSYKR